MAEPEVTRLSVIFGLDIFSSLYRIKCLIFICNLCLCYGTSHNTDHEMNGLCTLKCPIPLVDDSSYLFQWCNSTGSDMFGRCCINDTKTLGNDSIIGVSLSECDNLKRLHGILTRFKNLQVILLDHTDLDNDTVTPSQFNGLSQLNYLTLPESVACPGGHEAWDDIQYSTNETLCQDRVDICTVTNVSCNEMDKTRNTSYCVDMGPGLRECWCNHGYHGYKCLRKGEFPIILFAALTAGLTVVLSFFLWCTQRRHVKTE